MWFNRNILMQILLHTCTQHDFIFNLHFIYFERFGVIVLDNNDDDLLTFSRSLILLKISMNLVKMRPPPPTQSPTLLKPLTLSSISPKLLSLKLLRQRLLRQHLLWRRLLWTKLRNLRQRKPRMHKLVSRPSDIY